MSARRQAPGSQTARPGATGRRLGIVRPEEGRRVPTPWRRANLGGVGHRTTAAARNDELGGRCPAELIVEGENIDALLALTEAVAAARAR